MKRGVKAVCLIKNKQLRGKRKALEKRRKFLRENEYEK